MKKFRFCRKRKKELKKFFARSLSLKDMKSLQPYKYYCIGYQDKERMDTLLNEKNKAA